MGKRVAIVGASNDRAKFGNKAVRAYLRQGWTVYPVNPNEKTVEGLTAYPTVAAIPGPVDRVTLYLPPALGLKVLPDIQSKGAPEFFVNPGAESPDLVAESQRLGLSPILACSIIEIGERP